MVEYILVKVIISGSHLIAFPEMEAYAQKRLAKLAKYHSKIEEIRARLISETSHKNKLHSSICELEVDIPGKNLEIVEHDGSMDKAIDTAVERMRRLLVKTKEKSISRQHKQGLKIRNKI